MASLLVRLRVMSFTFISVTYCRWVTKSHKGWHILCCINFIVHNKFASSLWKSVLYVCANSWIQCWPDWLGTVFWPADSWAFHRALSKLRVGWIKLCLDGNYGPCHSRVRALPGCRWTLILSIYILRHSSAQHYLIITVPILATAFYLSGDLRLSFIISELWTHLA